MIQLCENTRLNSHFDSLGHWESTLPGLIYNVINLNNFMSSEADEDTKYKISVPGCFS